MIDAVGGHHFTSIEDNKVSVILLTQNRNSPNVSNDDFTG